MITTDMNTLSSDLAEIIAEFDAQISPTLGGTLVRAAADTDAHVARLVRQFVGQESNQRRLIDMVRSLTVGVSDSEPSSRRRHADASERTSQLPHVEDTERTSRYPSLPVAPLAVPDRITKRDYNYFDALNAALAALP